jgi:hypothetical protein
MHETMLHTHDVEATAPLVMKKAAQQAAQVAIASKKNLAS